MANAIGWRRGIVRVCIRICIYGINGIFHARQTFNLAFSEREKSSHFIRAMRSWPHTVDTHTHTHRSGPSNVISNKIKCHLYWWQSLWFNSPVAHHYWCRICWRVIYVAAQRASLPFLSAFVTCRFVSGIHDQQSIPSVTSIDCERGGNIFFLSLYASIYKWASALN